MCKKIIIKGRIKPNLCYYKIKGTSEVSLRVTNRDILRNIKIIAKEKGKTLKSISLGLNKQESYISATISKKKKLVSLELLFDIAKYLEVEIDAFLITEIKSTKEAKEHDNSNS